MPVSPGNGSRFRNRAGIPPSYGDEVAFRLLGTGRRAAARQAAALFLLGGALLIYALLRSAGMRVPAAAPPSDDARVNRLYDLIATGFHERLTLQGMAESVGWHPVYMQRRFRSALRFTPHELLVGHRIEYARDLIAGGALVTYAAHAAGFSDQSHLHKTFLSTYAVVPGEYRKLSALDALQPPSARNGISG